MELWLYRIKIEGLGLLQNVYQEKSSITSPLKNKIKKRFVAASCGAKSIYSTGTGNWSKLMESCIEKKTW